MRVLVGMPEKGAWGGPNASEPPIVNELRRLGLTVAEETYIFGSNDSPSLWIRIKRVVRAARALERRVKTESFDIIHLNTYFDFRAVLRDLFTLVFVRPRNVKVFLKCHGSNATFLATRNVVLRVLSQQLLSRVDGVGLLSVEEKANFVAAGFAAPKFFIVKNAVEPERFVPDSTFPLPEAKADTPLLLFCARLVREKGLLDVIRACKIVRDRGEKFLLMCLGDGPARAEAEAEAARLRLEQETHFCGYVPEERVAQFYVHSTIFVFPTYYQEGLPMVLLNSLAAGVPIITTRIRGAVDYLQEPRNCLWVEPRNPVMLAERIGYLLQHAELRARMIEHNRELAKGFSPGAAAGEVLDIYRQISQTSR